MYQGSKIVQTNTIDFYIVYAIHAKRLLVKTWIYYFVHVEQRLQYC